jgi:hypothetical protein
MTALHWASLKGHDVVAELLIGVGAVRLVLEQDTGGDTALRLAWQKKHHSIAAYLLKSWVFYKLFGRPSIFKSPFAIYSLIAMFMNWWLYFMVMVPELGTYGNLDLVILYPVFASLAFAIWAHLKFSDPGFVEPPTIEPQYDRIQLTLAHPATEQMEHVLAEQLDPGSAEYTQSKVHYQHQLIQEARRKAEDGEDGADFQFLDQASFALRPKMEAARPPVAQARRQQLVDEGRTDYLQLVEDGAAKQVCTICRAVKKLRSHHCTELGRCISRFDHFCPWVDNAIGLKNQRAFIFFLLSLETSLVIIYMMVFRLFGTYWGFDQSSTQVYGWDVWKSVLVAFLNLLWFGFIGALIIRHIVYMACNITTFEVIVRPPHVVKRFPKKRMRILCLETWFLEGVTIMDYLQHSLAFWMLDEEHDFRVYTADAELATTGGSGYAAMDTEDPEANRAEANEGF